MQIMIDIPEDLKKMIFDDEVFDIAHSYRLAMCVKNGTPLPKGHEQALEAAKIIRDYCNSFPFMSCKGCVFDRVTGCTLKNPTDFPETWELNDKIYPKDEKEVD